MVAMGMLKQVETGVRKKERVKVSEMWNRTMEVLEQVTYMDECT